MGNQDYWQPPQDGFDYEFGIRPLSRKNEGTERRYECRLVKTDDSVKTSVVKALDRDALPYKLFRPRRQFYLQFIKFASGKGPKNYVEYYKELDDRCQDLYGSGKTRHSYFDIHESLTFITLGEYDMVVIWDAPDATTFSEFLANVINHGRFGSNQHSEVSQMIGH